MTHDCRLSLLPAPLAGLASVSLPAVRSPLPPSALCGLGGGHHGRPALKEQGWELGVGEGRVTTRQRQLCRCWAGRHGEATSRPPAASRSGRRLSCRRLSCRRLPGRSGPATAWAQPRGRDFRLPASRTARECVSLIQATESVVICSKATENC